MDRVTHSLALKERGLFEIGRYPAASFTRAFKVWQWLIHHHSMNADDLEELRNASESPEEFLDLVYQGLAGKPTEDMIEQRQPELESGGTITGLA